MFNVISSYLLFLKIFRYPNDVQVPSQYLRQKWLADILPLSHRTKQKDNHFSKRRNQDQAQQIQAQARKKMKHPSIKILACEWIIMIIKVSVKVSPLPVDVAMLSGLILGTMVVVKHIIIPILTIEDNIIIIRMTNRISVTVLQVPAQKTNTVADADHTIILENPGITTNQNHPGMIKVSAIRIIRRTSLIDPPRQVQALQGPG